MKLKRSVKKVEKLFTEKNVWPYITGFLQYRYLVYLKNIICRVSNTAEFFSKLRSNYFMHTVYYKYSASNWLYYFFYFQ